jgi:predicted ATPase
MATMSTVMIRSISNSHFGSGVEPRSPHLMTGRRGSPSASTKEFPPFRLDSINQCLWRRGDGGEEERLPIKPKPFAILRYLVDHAGRLVTQDELLDAVWPDTHVQPDVLKRHVFEVRELLGDDPKNPTYIETLPRRGYQFIAAVRNAESAEPTAAEIRSQAKIVGRDGQLRELRVHLGKAVGGRRQIVFVTGEPGIGKTTLVDKFQRQTSQEQAGARTPIRIARGQCVEMCAGKEAYYPVMEALSNLCRGPDGDSVVQILAAQAPTWLVQFPALLNRQKRENLQPEIQGSTRQRMLREISEALETIASERALILVLEDLNWLDASALDLISALARGRGTAKLMVIGTYRPAEVALADHPLKAVKQDLLVHHLCHEVALEPLREEEIAAYLASESPDASVPKGLAALLHKHTEGNPLFMVVALDHMSERGFISRENGTWKLHVPIEQIDLEVPESLRQMIELQIERLSEGQRRALEAASITGVLFSAVVNATAANMDVEEFEDLCEWLSRRHYIVRSANRQEFPNAAASGRYQFIHALYREVLYRRQLPGRRAKLHLQIAERLETLFEQRLSEVARELAYHFERGGDPLRASQYWQVAAR